MVKLGMVVVRLNSGDTSVVTPRCFNAKLCTSTSVPDEMVFIELENGSSALAADWGVLASGSFPNASPVGRLGLKCMP